jgi:hypothetical protein
MISLLVPALLLAAEQPPPTSMLPLSDQLLLKHFGETAPPANSGYGTERRRRRMTELTAETTDRIRIHVDYESLYEETAPLYSACFKVGAWYARGLAGPTPPANGVATCRGETSGAQRTRCAYPVPRTTRHAYHVRLASTPESLRLADQDCWGKCTADDIIEETGRDQVKAVVDLVVKEVEGFFSLIRSDEALTFDNSLGRYVGVYNSKGYPSEEACARDCTLVNGAAVAPYYCVTGVPADVVLSITKPPVIPGVAGTGGGCASEETGRPTWIVFAWIQKIVGFPGKTTEKLLEEHRPLIIHEIIHGLGFSNIKFRSATDSQGERKGLVTLGKVEDLDGA